MASVQKICVGCNTDVANKKRVKDTEGNYYCQRCFEAKTGAKKTPQPVAAAAAASTAGAAVADPYDIAPVADHGVVDFADDPKPVAEPMAADMFGCADCKKLVNAKQIRNDDGDFVCAQCFASRKAGRVNPKAQPRKTFAQEEGVSDEPRFHDTIFGGIVIAAVIAVVGFGAHLGLLMAFPEKHAAASLPLSILTSGMMTVLMVFQAGALIGSMFITARILGGCDFGSLGNAFWKSMAVVLVLHVINYFMPSIGFYTFGLRGLILVVTFMAVFRLDHFEAVLLAVINFFLFLGLAIAMGIAIFAASRALAPHSFNDEDDAPALHQGPDLKPLAPQGAAPADNNNPAPADNNAQPAPPGN